MLAPNVFGDGRVVGGGERYAIELARALARRRPVCLSLFGAREDEFTDAGLRIRITRSRPLRGDVTNPFTLAIHRAIVGADVVHCIGYHKWVVDIALIAGRLSGRRVFVTDIGGGGLCPSTCLEAVRGYDLAFLAKGHLALSQFAAAAFPQLLSRSRIIYGGVDPSRFRRTAARESDLIVFVGRLLPHKGVDVLIQALPDGSRLEIYGRPYDSRYFNRLRQLASGRPVRFVTDAGDDNIATAYSRAAAVVLPSVYHDCYGNDHRVPELLGLALIEAMACETPVVATAVGGMPEVVRHGETGFVVPPGDIAALHNALHVLLEGPGLAAKIGAAAWRDVLARFTWDAVAERCLDAYEGDGACAFSG